MEMIYKMGCKDGPQTFTNSGTDQGSCLLEWKPADYTFEDEALNEKGLLKTKA